MIDSGKFNAAVLILSRLPSDKCTLVWNSLRESGTSAFRLEYSDHVVNFKVEHDAADPEVYALLLENGIQLIDYFVQVSTSLESEKGELLEAFRVTFNALMRENTELKSQIYELTENREEK